MSYFNKSNRIIIAGDSWGCGEWGWDMDPSLYDPNPDWRNFYSNVKGSDWPECPDFDDISLLPESILNELELFGFKGILSLSKSIGSRGVLHKGLEQYFKDDGYITINISEANQSNSITISRLISLLESHQEDISIIWIQTDPLRDLRPYDQFTNKFTTYNQILEYQSENLLNTYARLNSLDRDIVCLGGCSKIPLNMISRFKNLKPLIPSIMEWLIPQYSTPETYVSFVAPDITFSDWTNLIGKQFDLDSLDKLIYNKKIQDSLSEYPELFWPDGSHPNRHALKLVYDYIKNENLS